jgi:teichuronic acid biosynthesis glycosyltransferase TuaC
VRVLIVTKIFPNAAEPLSAPFNRQQFRALAALPGLDVTVLGTIPWFPGARLLARWSSAGRVASGAGRRDHRRAAGASTRARCSSRGTAHGVVGPAVRRVARCRAWRRHRGQVDVVLGSWAYPDGFAAVLLARALGVPAVVKLHGSDINVMAQEPGPRAAGRVGAAARRRGGRGEPTAGRRRRRARRGPVAHRASSATGSTASASSRAIAPPPGPRSACPPKRRMAVYVGNLKREQGRARPGWRRSPHLRARVPTAQPGAGRRRRGAQRAVDGAAGPLGRRAALVGGPCAPDDVATWMAAADVVVLPSLGRGHAQRAAGGAGVRSPRRRHPRRRDPRRVDRAARHAGAGARPGRRWPTRWRRRWSHRTIRAAIAAPALAAAGTAAPPRC